jgi:hypothetical protein
MTSITVKDQDVKFYVQPKVLSFRTVEYGTTWISFIDPKDPNDAGTPDADDYSTDGGFNDVDHDGDAR